MNGNKNDSKRIAIAVIALLVVFLILSVFTVNVYQGKRSSNDDLGYDMPAVDSTEAVSRSELSVSSEDPVSSEVTSMEEVSSQEVVSDVSSETESAAVIDMEKNKNEYIINPDYKSKFYIVIYTKNQTLVAYKKDSNGGYTKKYRSIRCSTGVLRSTPTRTGVYRIEKKYRWYKLMGGVYAQYCSLISDEDGYYIHSVPYTEMDPSTMSDSAYDMLGKSASHGCIRLCTRDAFWVYLNMPVGTQVSVVDAKGPASETVPKRNTDPKYSGWDPSDKWSKGNPYFATPTTQSTAPSSTTSANANASSAPSNTTTAPSENKTTTTTAGEAVG